MKTKIQKRIFFKPLKQKNPSQVCKGFYFGGQ